MAILTPKYFVESVFCIKGEDLRALGYKALFLDADNTLLPRDADRVEQDVIDWAHGLVDHGFELIILSNNWHDRVKNLSADMDLPLQGNAWKPLPMGFWGAQKRVKASKREVLVVGDQLFTDVLGAKPLGIDIAKVVPQVERDLPHTVFLRNFEDPLMGKLTPSDKLRPEFRLT